MQSAGGRKPSVCVPESSIWKAGRGLDLGLSGATVRGLNLVVGLKGPSLGSKQGEVLVWFLGTWGEERTAQALALGSGGGTGKPI